MGALAVLLVAGCLTLPGAAEATPAADEALLETELGAIRVQLWPDKAPQTVRNFRDLVRKGFYDGTTFHRAIPNYIVQGGSPTSKDADLRNDNYGGPGYTIAAEFNDMLHDRGMLAMARDVANPDSAGSQFFIVLARSPQLDAIRFTVFGKVTGGLELLDRIANAPRDEENHDRPLSPVLLRRARLLEVAAPAPRPAASARPPVLAPRVRILQEGVNVREGPGTDRAVVARVGKGAEFAVRGREGEWISVELSSGKLGWVRQDMAAAAP